MIKKDQFPMFDKKGRALGYSEKIYKFSFLYEGLKQRATFTAANLTEAKKQVIRAFPTATSISVESF